MESPQNHRVGWWQFINSNFGLWFLTALLITGAGSLFTWHQNLKANDRRRTDLVEKLDLEIGYRYFEVMNHLWKLSILNLGDVKLA